MKTRIILIALLALISHVDYAQDMIMYKNGTSSVVKVIEITGAEIYFNTTDKPVGPALSVLRKKVHMIQFANGSKIVFGAGQGSTQNEKNNKKEQTDANPQITFSESLVEITSSCGSEACACNVTEPERKN